MSSPIAEVLQLPAEPQWLAETRAIASTELRKLEWPKPDQEEWRRTSLDGFPFENYAQTRSQTAESGNSAVEGDGRITYDNGLLTHFSRPASLREQGGFLFAYPLDSSHKDLSADQLSRLREVLAQSSTGIDSRFDAWNLSSWTQGALLYVPDGVVLADPVCVEYLNPAEGELVQTHTFVVLGRNAQATVVQHHAGGADSLWNAGVTSVVGEGGRLELSRTQEVSDEASFFGNARVHLAKDSVFSGFEALTGGRLTKARTEIFLEGEGADAQADGVYFTRAGQHADIKTVQYHRAPHGNSRAFYKGAVSEGGRSIYQGLIDVEKIADGTDAYLTNRNLILGDGARADSIPCLEIRTNDVKCSHGSTSGRIDPEELFYLMSRGIPREDAERDLIVGYFEEVIQKAPRAARDAVRSRIESLLGLEDE